MTFFLSLRTCGVVALLLAVGGCGNLSHLTGQTVSQKPAASQTPSYQSSGYSQNVATSRFATQPAPPTMPVVPASTVPAGKVKAAILLPLTGKNAALGQAMLNAAQQAVFDAAGNNFELQPHDTALPGGAEAAAHAAAAGGAQLVIGPLFATDIPPVKQVALGAGLSMMALSTDTSQAERGVYVMGLAPGPQVERVVDYAAAHGARHFAAIVPDTIYGSLVGQVFRNSVAQHGGTVVDYETFDSVAQGGADRVKNLAAVQGQVDALFLPESGADLKALVDQLTAAGFTLARAHILGTGLWDEAGLGKQNALLVGAWYVAPDPAARKNFIAAYRAAYGAEPPRLTSLAYDATALAAVLAKRGAHYDEAAMTNPNGFAGLDGIFRLLPNGQVERALAVNEITPDGARVVDAAPVSFVMKK